MLVEASAFLSSEYGDLVVHLGLQAGIPCAVLTMSAETCRLVLLGPNGDTVAHGPLRFAFEPAARHLPARPGDHEGHRGQSGRRRDRSPRLRATVVPADYGI